MAAARDGSLQLGFGLGKYTNRNVMDGYGGISRGVEQITVRASRRLAPDPERTVIGPIRYEVVEPLRKRPLRPRAQRRAADRVRLAFEAALPPQLEDRTHLRTATASPPISSATTRPGSLGLGRDRRRARPRSTPDTWVSTRDHSWGVRYDVGAAAADVEPTSTPLAAASFQFIWCPALIERPDGTSLRRCSSTIEIFRRHRASTHKIVMGGDRAPRRRVEQIVDIAPELALRPANRRLRGGRLALHDGRRLPRGRSQIEVVSDTGFHLGAGLYFGFDGHHHGEWRGDLHVDGERIADCSTPENAARGCTRSATPSIRVDRPGRRRAGLGNCQPIITGAHPRARSRRTSSFT